MMSDLLGGQEPYIILNHHESGLSRHIINAAFTRQYRCSIVETTTMLERFYPDCPNVRVSNPKLGQILRDGPKLEQCLVLIPMAMDGTWETTVCDPENRKLLEICKELEIPTLVILVPWTFEGVQQEGGTLLDAATADLIGQMIRLQFPAHADLAPVRSPLHVLRNMEYADCIMRLVGTKFDQLATIQFETKNEASITSNQ